jgi:hypothetical protein
LRASLLSSRSPARSWRAPEILEAIAIKRAVEPEIKADAKERMVIAHSGGKLPQQEAGKTRDKVSKFTGKKPRSLAKAEEVVRAGQTASPGAPRWRGLRRKPQLPRPRQTTAPRGRTGDRRLPEMERCR